MWDVLMNSFLTLHCFRLSLTKSPPRHSSLVVAPKVIVLTRSSSVTIAELNSKGVVRCALSIRLPVSNLNTQMPTSDWERSFVTHGVQQVMLKRFSYGRSVTFLDNSWDFWSGASFQVNCFHETGCMSHRSIPGTWVIIIIFGLSVKCRFQIFKKCRLNCDRYVVNSI